MYTSYQTCIRSFNPPLSPPRCRWLSGLMAHRACSAHQGAAFSGIAGPVWGACATSPVLRGLCATTPKKRGPSTWGACATSPVYRGLCATTPKRPRLPTAPATTCHAVNAASTTRRRAEPSPRAGASGQDGSTSTVSHLSAPERPGRDAALTPRRQLCVRKPKVELNRSDRYTFFCLSIQTYHPAPHPRYSRPQPATAATRRMPTRGCRDP
jgi:hypothetical protein